MKYCLAIVLLIGSFSAHAALNKWVDADGKVHYSDSPPADVKVQKLRGSSAPEDSAASSGVPAQKSIAEREAEWKKSQKTRDEAEQKVAREKEAEQIKQKNCDSARSTLAAYEKSPRMVQYDAKGEPSYLDDTARTQKIDEARKAVSSFCN
ncbi:MAG: hypothetical protein B7Y56_15440 [Gallionellales bacterium 35-53-114]|jgi:hypothetical protein|nr:MAG: hypothetical protein B7Y56_15440 [Gallionellales bacterium 35-53-114]OYZ63094.1 MAG: hypothetical protein B7Y04_11545 [Gallionellales bacterium 24-53-125]OZB08926.1 MAG: hypothetical protein B7X61_08055 [Gallionellales bacterium 39-52-133]HQS59403.1 DUF4124 domain-containing protein [Gallionellaceae bacterium]HQS76316.1 DUF4124 domain-containing protein [Gallionellaceae bacterium]